MATIKIKKLKELPNALHPNNIAEGFEREGHFINEPVLGERFYVGYDWSTSGVQEIIDDKTFRTYSSIYQWELID